MKILITGWIVFIYVSQEFEVVVGPTLSYILSLQRRSKNNEVTVTGADAAILLSKERTDWENSVARAETDVRKVEKSARLKFSPIPQKMAINVATWQANKQRLRWARSILQNTINEMSAANLCLHTAHAVNFCQEAFKNSYFMENGLHYKQGPSEKCYLITVVNMKTEKPDTNKRYVKKCSAIRKTEKGETEVNVFVSASIYYKENLDLKFYVFLDDKESKNKENVDAVEVTAFLINKQ